jgi:hypothetical protein
MGMEGAQMQEYFCGLWEEIGVVWCDWRLRSFL